jgi:hypothetical protein
MGSVGYDSGLLSGRRIAVIGRFTAIKTNQKKLKHIIKDLGGKNSRSTDKELPTDLIWANTATGQETSKVEEPSQVRRFRERGVNIHGPDWLFDFQKRKNGEKYNVEPPRLTGQTESSIRIPSRQIVPVPSILADETTGRVRGGREHLCSMGIDTTLNTVIPDTLSSNSQDKEATANVEPKRTSQHAPDEDQNRVVECPRVLCTYKTPPCPPKKASKVHVKCIPDVSN